MPLGYNPGIREDGRIERLEVGGSVIGMMDFAAFALGSVPIAPGDVLLGFTDGVSECMNPRDEEWGDDRLAEVSARIATAPRPWS